MPSGIHMRANRRQGKDNFNYRGGNSNCIDCKKELSYRSLKPKRCRNCYSLFARGENAPNWKGGDGFPSCINCNGKTGDSKSMLCRKCYRGALSPHWKGGVSTIQSLVRNMPENRQFIKQCMYRDRYHCQDCGIESDGRNLQVHHLRQFALILKENNIKSTEDARRCEELWDNDNGVTLCRECHKLTKTFNLKLQ